MTAILVLGSDGCLEFLRFGILLASIPDGNLSRSWNALASRSSRAVSEEGLFLRELPMWWREFRKRGIMQRSKMHRTSENKAELRKIMRTSGIREAVKFLNSLTEHRFSALYRFDDKKLKNLYFFDREQPEIESVPEIPVLASYCVFVRDLQKSFTVENSLKDPRTMSHPKRLEILAYYGLPLLDRYGKMFGTICHFDVSARSAASIDVELMEEMASLLQEQLDRLN